jgi:Icc protein
MTSVTMHPRSSQAINVLQITDTHLFADGDGSLLGLNTEQSLQAILRKALPRKPRPDLVLATGDLVHDGTPAAYRRVFGHLDSLGLPVYCLAGNHDEATTLRQTLRGERLHYVPQLLQGDWQFIFLDSTLAGSEGGHLDRQALEALETRLAAAPDKHALVCLHHQPVPMGSRWLDTMAVDNAGDFLAVIDRHPQVRGILWGHVHQTFDQERNGVRLMATPSTCIQFLPGSDDFALDTAAPGYRWLSLYPDGRIETGVERLEEIPGTVDLASAGY